MFCLNDSTRYFLCPGSTDMRKGMFSLSGLIREKMNGDVRNGDVYIFINRLKNRIKLLHAETGGLVMYEKLLEEGTFKIPAYQRGQTKGKAKTALRSEKTLANICKQIACRLAFPVVFHYLYTIKQDIE